MLMIPFTLNVHGLNTLYQSSVEFTVLCVVHFGTKFREMLDYTKSYMYNVHVHVGLVQFTLTIESLLSSNPL